MQADAKGLAADAGRYQLLSSFVHNAANAAESVRQGSALVPGKGLALCKPVYFVFRLFLGTKRIRFWA